VDFKINPSNFHIMEKPKTAVIVNNEEIRPNPGMINLLSTNLEKLYSDIAIIYVETIPRKIVQIKHIFRAIL
jgi:hypothetical protein